MRFHLGVILGVLVPVVLYFVVWTGSMVFVARRHWYTKRLLLEEEWTWVEPPDSIEDNGDESESGEGPTNYPVPMPSPKRKPFLRKIMLPLASLRMR